MKTIIIDGVEYNLTPKVVFHKGDWVVSEVTGSIYQIDCIEILNNHKCGYHLTNDGYISSDEVNHYHLWTIQDAKDGDVLASELCCTIMLYKGIEDNNIQFYCDYDFSDIDVPGDRFAINNGQHYGSVDDSDDWHPATKEQRDQLEKAMSNAGYRWNKEELKLEKI